MNIPKIVKQKFKDNDTITIFVWFISLALILFGIIISIMLYSSGRALWLDEAMLAVSFNTRNISELTSAVFELDQSAPVLYLYIVKLITLIFGTTEATLRLYSFFAYLGTLYVAYLLLQKAFVVKYPILGVAFISNMSILLYYSNEFKPYMSDCLVVLLVLYLYYLFSTNNLNLLILFLIYAIFVWLSFPAIFFIGGVFTYEFIVRIQSKDKKAILIITIGIIFILLNFAIEYFTWLKPVATSEYMIHFWMDYRFPVIPKNIEDAKNLLTLLINLIDTMHYSVILIWYLTIIGLVRSIYTKNKYGIITLMSLFLVLLASSIGKYPFSPRLMLFIFPLIGIAIFITLDYFMEKDSDWGKRVVVMGLIIPIFLSNYVSLSYLTPEGRHKENQEVNKLIEYVDTNIKYDELLFVYFQTKSAFRFKNGYDNLHIGKNIQPSIENIIFGNEYWPPYQVIENYDIKTISSQNKCYILLSYQLEPINEFMQYLTVKGYLELVMKDYSTPLYFFSKNLDQIKTDVKFELIDYQIKNNKCSANILITNTGKAYLNSSELNDIYIRTREYPDLNIQLEEKDIKPGEKRSIEIEFDWPENFDQLDIQLVNKDKYWFDEIGIEPIHLDFKS